MVRAYFNMHYVKPRGDMHCVRKEKQKDGKYHPKKSTSCITVTNQILQTTIINAERNSGSIIDIDDLESHEARQQSNANDRKSDWL